MRALADRRRLRCLRCRVTVVTVRGLRLGVPARPRDLRTKRRMPLASRRHPPAILGIRPSAPHIAVTSCCPWYLRFGKITTSSRQMPIFATLSGISACHSSNYLGKTSHYRTFHNRLAARSPSNVAPQTARCRELRGDPPHVRATRSRIPPVPPPFPATARALAQPATMTIRLNTGQPGSCPVRVLCRTVG